MMKSITRDSFFCCLDRDYLVMFFALVLACFKMLLCGKMVSGGSLGLKNALYLEFDPHGVAFSFWNGSITQLGEKIHAVVNAELCG